MVNKPNDAWESEQKQKVLPKNRYLPDDSGNKTSKKQTWSLSPLTEIQDNADILECYRKEKIKELFKRGLGDWLPLLRHRSIVVKIPRGIVLIRRRGRLWQSRIWCLSRFIGMPVFRDLCVSYEWTVICLVWLSSRYGVSYFFKVGDSFDVWNGIRERGKWIFFWSRVSPCWSN